MTRSRTLAFALVMALLTGCGDSGSEAINPAKVVTYGYFLEDGSPETVTVLLDGPASSCEVFRLSSSADDPRLCTEIGEARF